MVNNLLTVIAISFVAILLCMAGFGVKMLVRRGEFKRHCASRDPHSGECSECHCAAKDKGLSNCHRQTHQVATDGDETNQ